MDVYEMAFGCESLGSELDEYSDVDMRLFYYYYYDDDDGITDCIYSEDWCNCC